MAQILCFSRNRSVNVEQVDEQTMRASCLLQDSIMEAYVAILIKLPDLEITDAQGQISRSVEGREMDASESLRKAVGVRIGPGLKKILKGVMGNSAIEKQLAFMVEECCGSVILTFTKDVLRQAPNDKLKERAYFNHFVRSNPRLYNSCAAFAPGSPLVEGIEPPR